MQNSPYLLNDTYIYVCVHVRVCVCVCVCVCVWVQSFDNKKTQSL